MKFERPAVRSSIVVHNETKTNALHPGILFIYPVARERERVSYSLFFIHLLFLFFLQRFDPPARSGFFFLFTCRDARD